MFRSAPCSFLIGTALWSFYADQNQAPGQGELITVRQIVAKQELLQAGVSPTDPTLAGQVFEAAPAVPDAKIGDRVFPHFIANHLPAGARGLLIAAIFAAAMSTVSTGLNSSATLLMSDFYRRFLQPQATGKQEMLVLRLGTIIWGVLGTGLSLVLVKVTQSALDTWWVLSGILGGSMTGLFLLGMLSRRATRTAGITGLLVGMAAIAGLTWAKLVGSPVVHANLIPVIGVLLILAVGLSTSRTLKGKNLTS